MGLFLFFILSLMSVSVAAGVDEQNTIQRVWSGEGNIYLTGDDGRPVQVTRSGKDTSPVLSPDRTMVAFIRTGDKIIPKGCDDFSDTKTKYGNQVWIYDVVTKKDRLLVQNNFSCDIPEKQIVDPGSLQFSPENKTLYFITSAWMTSGALHAVNVDGTGEHYVIPASSLEVITKGQHKGDLIVGQHRYFIGGGSYDWLWLYTPQGKEEGPLGDEVTQSQREVIEMD
jgi:hypothetical protein